MSEGEAVNRDPVVGRVPMTAWFPPGVSESVALELHESGAVTWRPKHNTPAPYRSQA